MYRYLYCITREFHKPFKGIIGISNMPVYTLNYQGVVALLSDVSTATISVSNENILYHASVIETVHKEQTVLPMRFSSMLNNHEEVIKFLKNGYSVFIDLLERLQDKVEMGIRIIMKVEDAGRRVDSSRWQPGTCKDRPTPPQRVNITAGGAYLEQQRSHYAMQDENNSSLREIVSACHAQFEGIYVGYKKDAHSLFQGVSINYLIPKYLLSEFRNRFHDLRTSLRELKFLCTGPWPPYHFVSSEV